MNNWKTLVSDDTIKKTIDALGANGISSEVVNSGEEAKEKALNLIPEGSEVMTMSSATLETLGLTKEFNETGKYNSIKEKFKQMDRNTQGIEMKKLGSAPIYAIGSVNAVTQEGHIIFASNTGSQLPAYAYGSSHVVWIVGTQKIVKNVEEGLQRIHEYILPLESKRLRKVFNLPDTYHSNASKLLIINKEINPNRLHIIFVKEVLGY